MAAAIALSGMATMQALAVLLTIPDVASNVVLVCPPYVMVQVGAVALATERRAVTITMSMRLLPACGGTFPIVTTPLAAKFGVQVPASATAASALPAPSARTANPTTPTHPATRFITPASDNLA